MAAEMKKCRITQKKRKLASINWNFKTGVMFLSGYCNGSVVVYYKTK
jgi:hypothetical protein